MSCMTWFRSLSCSTCRFLHVQVLPSLFQNSHQPAQTGSNRLFLRCIRKLHCQHLEKERSLTIASLERGHRGSLCADRPPRTSWSGSGSTATKRGVMMSRTTSEPGSWGRSWMISGLFANSKLEVLTLLPPFGGSVACKETTVTQTHLHFAVTLFYEGLWTLSVHRRSKVNFLQTDPGGFGDKQITWHQMRASDKIPTNEKFDTTIYHLNQGFPNYFVRGPHKLWDNNSRAGHLT